MFYICKMMKTHVDKLFLNNVSSVFTQYNTTILNSIPIVKKKHNIKYTYLLVFLPEFLVEYYCPPRMMCYF